MAVNTEDNYQEIIGEDEAVRDKYVFTHPDVYKAQARLASGKSD
jgi:hypothetical protein